MCIRDSCCACCNMVVTCCVEVVVSVTTKSIVWKALCVLDNGSYGHLSLNTCACLIHVFMWSRLIYRFTQSHDEHYNRVLLQLFLLIIQTYGTKAGNFVISRGNITVIFSTVQVWSAQLFKVTKVIVKLLLHLKQIM